MDSHFLATESLFFSATSLLFTLLTALLVVFADAGVVAGLTIAALNAIAALMTGYAALRTLRQEKKSQEDSAPTE